MAINPGEIDIRRIMQFLPHRYPFLMVDRVVECVSASHVKAYKNVSINEPFFQGHFPGLPVMPGVLILEALAQAGAIAVVSAIEGDLAGKVFLFTGINKVKFRRPVVPGDRLDLEITDIRRKFAFWMMSGRATVDGDLVAQGEFSAAVVEKGSFK